MPDCHQWILTVDPACSLDQLCEELGRRGYAVASVLREIGVIVVSGQASSQGELRVLKGVISVEPETAIDIGPPGSPGTW